MWTLLKSTDALNYNSGILVYETKVHLETHLMSTDKYDEDL